MLPEGAHKKIRSVRIFYLEQVTGFSFFDKDGALIMSVGDTTD
jgi:hypothetical protein